MRDRIQRPNTWPGLTCVLRTAALVAVLSGLAVILVPRPVAAHAELERSSPAPDALLAAAPLQLDLWFTEEVAAGEGSPSVRLLDAVGQDQGLDEAAIDPADARHVTVDLPVLGPGTYTVVWSVRSAVDGHTLSGSYAFRIGGGRAPGAATVEGETPRPWAVATRWLTFLGAALAASAALLLWIVPAAIASSRPAGLALTGAVVALAATLAEPVLQTLDPPAGAEAPTLREAVRALPAAWWFRPALLLPAAIAALAWLLLTRRSRHCPNWLAMILLGCGLGALLGLSLTSHAAARDTWRLAAVVSDVLHQWSVALWVGGLAQVALSRADLAHSLPWRSRRIEDPPTSEVVAAEARVDAPDPVRRFSTLALGLVGVGLVTGVINSGFALPALRALWESDYGRVILVKVAVLVPALLLATYHRVALRRAAARAGATLRSTIRVETVVVALVVLGGSVLALLAPPVLEAEGPTFVDLAAPYDPTLGDTGPLLHLRVEPVAPGQNRLTVYATEPVEPPGAEQPRCPLAPGTEVELTLVPLNHDLAPLSTPAQPDGDGGFAAAGLDLSLDGWWQIDVRVQPPRELGVRQSFFLLLPDPNVHGADATEPRQTDDDAVDQARAVYERGLTALTTLQSVRWDERLNDGNGHVLIGRYALTAGSDGSPPALSIESARTALIRIGDREWLRRGDGQWTERANAFVFVPADLLETYAGATDFRLGRVEEIDGERSRAVSFFVPAAMGRSEAWYTWWVGEETGFVRQETMVARSHYMRRAYGDFNASFTIVPPTSEGATPAATPAASDGR